MTTSRRESALKKLRELLAGDRYPIGSRLPPERKLCIELNVSRSALREAYEVIEAEGRIWRCVGMGTFVGGRPVQKLSDFGSAVALSSPAEIMDVRLLLEPNIARLAALRASTADIQTMRYCLERSAFARDERTHEQWDRTLHRAIAESAHSMLLLALYDAFATVRDQTAWGTLGEVIFSPDRVREYHRQHQSLVDAIASRSADDADDAMRLHLESVQRNLYQAEKRRLENFSP